MSAIESVVQVISTINRLINLPATIRCAVARPPTAPADFPVSAYTIRRSRRISRDLVQRIGWFPVPRRRRDRRRRRRGIVRDGRRAVVRRRRARSRRGRSADAVRVRRRGRSPDSAACGSRSSG